MSQPIRVRCEGPLTPLVETVRALLNRTIRERCGVETVSVDAGAAAITLSVIPGVGPEGFSIEDGPQGVRIVGHDERGLLYGVGKFLRSSGFGEGIFTPGSWRGTSVPAKPVRAMYFASHFHNFYHDAPIGEVERYVEELALWGCNALSVWFDMHHYRGIDDPEAQAMIARLHAILRAAGRVGMSAGLTTLANEAYADSPAELRADWTAGHDGYTRPPGGHYHVEICPNKPGGLDLILRLRGEMLDAFRDFDIEHVWIWPYDQGGCTCSACAPWGANGFFKTAEAVSAVIRERCPRAKVVLSTWYFDEFIAGEWEAFSRVVEARKPDWIDYLLVDGHSGFPDYVLKHGAPRGLPMVSFPEISMQGMFPWGGFGANPRPDHWQRYWNAAGEKLAGSFPYSEGLFEDINKVIILQFEWDPRRTAADIVREYAAYEYAPEEADRIVAVVYDMEAGMSHRVTIPPYRVLSETADGSDPLHPPLYELGKVREPHRCLDELNRVEARLSPRARTAWRWRILWLRAALDATLYASGGRPTPESESHFEELIRLYVAGNATNRWVLPPSLRSLKRPNVE